MEGQGKAPSSHTETHWDGEQQEPGAAKPSAGAGESPWGCPGGSGPAGLELSQIIHSARPGSAGSSLSLLPVGNQRQCSAPSVPALLVQTKRLQLTEQTPDSCSSPGTAMAVRHRSLTLLSCYCPCQGQTHSPVHLWLHTAGGDTRTLCREREIPAELLGCRLRALILWAPPGTGPAHTPQWEQQNTA